MSVTSVKVPLEKTYHFSKRGSGRSGRLPRCRLGLPVQRREDEGGDGGQGGGHVGVALGAARHREEEGQCEERALQTEPGGRGGGGCGVGSADFNHWNTWNGCLNHRCPSIEWECVAYVESLLLRVHNQQSLLGFMAVPSSEKDVF